MAESTEAPRPKTLVTGQAGLHVVTTGAVLGGPFNIPYVQGVVDFANVFASKPVVTLTVESSEPEHLISARLEFVESKRFGFRLWRDTPDNPWAPPVIIHWQAIDVIAFVRDL